MTDPRAAGTDGPAISRADRVSDMVQELRLFGLSEVDAQRAAFCALALGRGWPKARIARYLGVSRARVGQKAEKLQDYVTQSVQDDGPPAPELAMALLDASVASPDLARAGAIEFRLDDWRDLEFGRRLCEMLA